MKLLLRWFLPSLLLTLPPAGGRNVAHEHMMSAPERASIRLELYLRTHGINRPIHAMFFTSNIWYIRTDGGTRYSSAVTTGQCDGLADVAYPGTGTNQHCAFNDFRYTYSDNSGNAMSWVIAGGDTVIIRGCHALSGQSNPSNPNCRIGSDNNTDGGTPPNAWGGYGNPATSQYSPPVPSGTSGQHTRILGQNYAACNTGGAVDPKTYASNLTQIFGGFSVAYDLNLQGSSYVDVQCIEFTAHNGVCVTRGLPEWPRGCVHTNPGYDDYADNGLTTSPTSTNILLQDVYLHGFNSSGLFGPIGAGITMTRVNDSMNTFSAWNFDDGSSTPDGTNASIAANHVFMLGLGCQETYPNTTYPAYPAMVCYDTNSNGFGDTWSGQNTVGLFFTCNDCHSDYATKDCFIGPHTAFATLTITNSETVGCMGQAWKWGANGTAVNVTFTNNLTVAQCARMSVPPPGADPGLLGHLAFVQPGSTPGSGYTNGDVLTVVQAGGSGATVQVTVSGGIPVSYTVLTAGSGYINANGLTTTGGTGTNAHVNVQPTLTGFCRAAGNAFAIVISAGSAYTIANNTIVTYNPTVFDIACTNPPGNPCASNVYLKNNILLGYNTGYVFSPFSGQAPGLYFIEDASIVTTCTNNVQFGMRNTSCTSASGIIASDPLLHGEPAQGSIPPETNLDNFNFYLASTGSPPYGAAAAGYQSNFSALCGGAAQNGTVGACGVYGAGPVINRILGGNLVIGGQH